MRVMNLWLGGSHVFATGTTTNLPRRYVERLGLDSSARPMQPPAIFIDRIDRLIVMDRTGRHDLRDLIVEDIGLAVDIDGEDRMGDAEIEIVQHDDTHVVDGHAEIA